MREAWREYLEEQRAISERMKRRAENLERNGRVEKEEEPTTLRTLSELLVRSEASASP